MAPVLSDEKPDYAIHPDTFKENATTLIDEIVAPLNTAKIPFSSSHGNHDNQANITHLEEIMREQQVAPLSVGGVGGPGNYWVPPIATVATTDRAPVLILWFFDSRGLCNPNPPALVSHGLIGGFSPNPNSTALPDWVDASVADWIKSETRPWSGMGAHERSGHVVSTLQAKLNPTRNPGLNADSLGSGSVQDSSSTGQDSPFWDALNLHVKNIHAVISGHDHGNEWCIREQVKNVIFCFDKHSGYGGYDGVGWGHGVRNIQFSSPNPQAGPETWIRLEDGEIRARITLNQHYQR
ncbi:hypothetical protein BD779DRAFT_1558538 [Infundibulicybe gibba]|nr:hypothetical protein BD779DRAFT_1558538 [Infundibulicybe gibba]